MKGNPFDSPTGNPKTAGYVPLGSGSVQTPKPSAPPVDAEPSCNNVNAACVGKCLCYTVVGVAASAVCGAGASVLGSLMAQLCHLTAHLGGPTASMAVSSAEYSAAAGTVLHGARGVYNSCKYPDRPVTDAFNPTRTCIAATGVAAFAGLPFSYAASGKITSAAEAVVPASIGAGPLTIAGLAGKTALSCACGTAKCICNTARGCCPF